MYSLPRMVEGQAQSLTTYAFIPLGVVRTSAAGLRNSFSSSKENHFPDTAFPNLFL